MTLFDTDRDQLELVVPSLWREPVLRNVMSSMMINLIFQRFTAGCLASLPLKHKSQDAHLEVHATSCLESYPTILAVYWPLWYGSCTVPQNALLAHELLNRVSRCCLISVDSVINTQLLSNSHYTINISSAKEAKESLLRLCTLYPSILCLTGSVRPIIRLHHRLVIILIVRMPCK